MDKGDLKETGGAGDQGTDQLVNKYKRDTPGQHILKQIRSITREKNDCCLPEPKHSNTENSEK
jgi:hypothetical protein